MEEDEQIIYTVHDGVEKGIVPYNEVEKLFVLYNGAMKLFITHNGVGKLFIQNTVYSIQNRVQRKFVRCSILRQFS